MRVVIVEHTGGPDVLKFKEMPTPEPRSDEVRVDVEACGVNFLDVYEGSGKYAMHTPFSPVPRVAASSQPSGTASTPSRPVTAAPLGMTRRSRGTLGSGLISSEA